MGVDAFQYVSMLFQLGIALALWTQRLTRRDHFWWSVACVILSTTLVAYAAWNAGFTLYPTLTDDASFIRSAGQFLGVLAYMTTAVMVIWDASPLTALFCSSSAYLLQDIASGLDRSLHLMRIVPTGVGQGLSTESIPLMDIVVLWGSAALVLSLFYTLLGSRLKRSGLQGINNPLMHFAVIMTMLVSIIFDLTVKDLPTFDIPWRYPVVLSCIQVAMNVFILIAEFEIIYNSSLRTSVATMESAIEEQERQFELSTQNIEAINRRVHDMRHHVFSILADGNGEAPDRDHLRQIAREISVYDASVKTGNAALDVVLTEKGLLCGQEGIALTCVADGPALNFMAPSDLYTLFASSIDGAIQEARASNSDDQRAISINVREAMGMASISIEHYLMDEHGPGKEANEQRFRTVESIVERYDGTLTLNLEDGIFHMNLLIPIPDA